MAARMQPRAQARRGFTIAEVMMAAAVMALAITTAITTMQRAFLAIDSSRNITIASRIMISEMERTRMLAWSDVSDWDRDEDTTLALDSVYTSNPQIGSRFSLVRRVTVPDAGNPNILQITFTTTWRGYDGRELSRSYTMQYARYGLHDYLYNTT